MKIKTLYNNPYMTNTYIVSDDAGNCAIIDPAGNSKIIIQVLSAIKLTPKAVLLTHGHYDHISALSDIAEQYCNLPVYIHKSEVPYLADSNLNLSVPLCGEVYTFYGNVKEVQSGSIIRIGALEFNVLHTPGHTPGSVCYITKDSIFSGDTLFASTVGRTDFPGGSYPTLLDSIKKLKSLEKDYNIYPGHNAATTLNREKMYNEYMQIQ